MVAIFTYAFQKAEDNFRNKNVRLVVLSDYPTLLSIGHFDEETRELLGSWRESPDTWEQ